MNIESRYRICLICFCVSVVNLSACSSKTDPCSGIEVDALCYVDQECGDQGLVCWCGICTPDSCTGYIDFPSYALEAAVRRNINKEDGAIRYVDVREIRYLRWYLGGDFEIWSLDGIECLASLRRLFLANNYIKDFSPLSDLRYLDELTISDNYNIDLNSLPSLPSLTSLTLSLDEITDIDSLPDLTSLIYLNLSENRITDIGPLSKMTGLTELCLNRNHLINDISAISFLTSLEKLDISTNRISDIEPISNLPELIELDASGVFSGGSNTISDIGALADLRNITKLDLEHNHISDLLPLVNNSGIGAGDEVQLRDNPIDCADQSANIQILRARGVNLLVDCP